MRRETTMCFWKRFINEEQGQDMVEYGLVVALIAMIVLVGVTTFGTNLNTGFGSINGKVATNVK
jgi:pilus assembly protein Flp/PilA